MPAEENDKPLYKHPESEEELISGMDDERFRLKKIAFLQANGAIGLRMNAALQVVAKRTKDVKEAESLDGGQLVDRARRRTRELLVDAQWKLDREIERTIGKKKSLREKWEEFSSTPDADLDENDGLLDSESGQTVTGRESASPAIEPSGAGSAAEPEQEDEDAEESHGVVVSLLAPDVAGDYAVFVALPERLIIVEEQEGDSDLGVLADAV